MRILLFSTLYPNAAAPAHGVFVENRILSYRKKYGADIKVVAPVPWFPFTHSVFGAYADFARAPVQEVRHGVEVRHPRYAVPPKLAMHFAPAALTKCLRREVRALMAQGWDFDVIDAHYFYPDGVAASRIAREFGKPLVITARGTDVSLIPNFQGPRDLIVDAAHRSDAIITVAAALKNELVRLGAQEEKISVLRNGVDLDTFYPGDREQERRVLGVEGLVIASVGHLIERKGHDLAIDALKALPQATLLIAGSGPRLRDLQGQAEASGVAHRVRFLGQTGHSDLRSLYSAADIFVLASSREGWPNVLLEAMACGTPCVATDVWGTGEVMSDPAAGRLVKQRSGEALADAIKDLLKSPPGRKATRNYAEQFSWDATADGMHAIFSALAEKRNVETKLRTSPIGSATAGKVPRLIVTVDTEETFDWDRFDLTEWRVEAPTGLGNFQTLCERLGVSPLYFLTWPILDDEKSALFFRQLVADGTAHAGLHLHQWTTPPEGRTGEFYTFQKNLSQQVQLEKLRHLAEKFEAVIGQKAISHRAGRYGIDKASYDLLASIGVEMDFSPSAAFDFSGRGGPDFSQMSNLPFSVSSDGWRVNVTPVCGAQAIRRTRSFLPQNRAEAGFSAYRERPSAAMKRPMRLSPEGAGFAELQALTRRLIADQTPVLTYTLHSTSLTPGANHYAPDQTSVDRLLSVTEAYLNWFRTDIGGEIVSLPMLCDVYRSASDTGDGGH